MAPITEVVRRVAEALQKRYEEHEPGDWEQDARTAIAAMREPTAEMIRAMEIIGNIPEADEDDLRTVWRAGILTILEGSECSLFSCRDPTPPDRSP